MRRLPLGEHDDLVVAFGLESGRFSAVSKGSRKARSRLAGLLEPPVELEGNLRHRPGLDSLSQVQLRRAFAGLRRRLEALLTAGFLARLFGEALPEGSPLPDAYSLFGALHERLAAGEQVAPVALWGQDRLLAEMGLEIAIECCLGCGDTRVRGYSARDGGVLCGDCYGGAGFSVSTGSLSALQALRATPAREALPAIPPADVREIGRMLKAQMQYHMGLPDKVFRPVLPKREPL